MNKLLISILVLLTIVSCKNDKDFYLSQDYKTVFKSAPKDNKKIFIDFYTTWCGSCKEYDKYIFSDSTFKSYLVNDFYSLKLDAELPKNKSIAKRYNIGAYPTIIIADSAGNEINRIIGFKSDKPKYYIRLIDNILQGKENFESYQKQYLNNPDSTELGVEIITKLFRSEDYQNVDKFVGLIKNNSENSDLLFQADLFLGFSKLYNKQAPNPTYLKNIFSSKTNLDDYWKEGILMGLIEYYQKVQIDSFEYYCYKLEKDYPKSYSLNRKFALYLYENRKDIETADRITNNYALDNPNDHWTPFLQGHSLVLKGNKQEAFHNFDSWLIKYRQTEENKNRYYKYIDLAVSYEFGLDKAIDYATKIENEVSNIYNKKLLAQLYYLTNQKDKAVKILKETIPLIETAKEKKKIDKMIEEYSI